MKEIFIGTKNEGKIKEIKEILNFSFVKWITFRELDRWLEIEEVGKTFEENAILKGKTFARYFNLPTISDDSGLEVDALGGEPGIYSSRYSEPESNDEKNIKKVLEKLKGVPFPERTARFRCVAAFVIPDGEIVTAEGLCEGHIGFEPKGEKGFGYDPIFIPLGYERTLAQFSLQEKNKISHRGKALRLLKRKIEYLLID